MTPPIYAITDPVLLPGPTLYRGVELALKGGVRWVQYRDKLATPGQRLARARELLNLCKDYDAKLIINDHLELAASIDAPGVHLGQGDGNLSEARNQLGAHAIIGATCHNRLDLAQRASVAGASYLAFGRFFSSSTKPDAEAATVATLQEARTRLAQPLVAIGGILPQHLKLLKTNGAATVAVCHGLFGADNIRTRAEEFLRTWNQIHV